MGYNPSACHRWVYRNGARSTAAAPQHGRGTRLHLRSGGDEPRKRAEQKQPQQSLCVSWESVAGRFRSRQNQSALSAQGFLGLKGHRNFGDDGVVLEPDYGCGIQEVWLPLLLFFQVSLATFLFIFPYEFWNKILSPGKKMVFSLTLSS